VGMNEARTRLELIDPQLRACGWGPNETLGSVVLPEHQFTDGRLIGAGQRGRQKKADYVLAYKNQKLAIIEAKAEGHEVTDGLEQVKAYAECLAVRYVYSTNGRGIYLFDMQTGRGEHVSQYYSPDELFDMTFTDWQPPQLSAMTEAFQRTKFSPRYYQENAINAAVEAIAGGKNRVLLTLATGTGKTFIAFQTVWKLYQSRWNKRGDEHRPRVLYLADRNVLVDQAMGDFNPLESVSVRINGEAVRRKGRIPTNGNVFFSIYQAMTGGPEDNPYYMDYPSDYFDLIVVDECHRGGAAQDGNWRKILDHFSGATHLGMTATPKRDDNIDTYAYFGNPVYTYSLKQGVEDGFLTPFKVKRVTTTMDRYLFNPADTVESGEVDESREYTLQDFNRAIYLPEREKRMTEIMLGQINPNQKTIVFCNDEKHAAMIRDYVNELKPAGTLGSHHNYCVRITATEGVVGDGYLSEFRDNEKMIPTIVTTSRKLSTGVDARNVRFVVLMRTVGSMVEFKQIIGRGTRIYDDKDYFTIVDFYGNDTKFQDDEWDGDPEEIIDAGIIDPEPTTMTERHPVYGTPDEGDESGVEDPGANPYGDGTPADDPVLEKQKTVIRFADGKERTIRYAVDTMFYLDGRPVTPQEFIEKLYGEVPELFKNEDDLRTQWSDPRTRSALLLGLAERGFDEDKLQSLKAMIDAEDCDVYDVLRYVAYARQTITRCERASLVREYYLDQLDANEKEFVSFILKTYESEGENELSLENLSTLIRLKYHTMRDAVTNLGRAESIVDDYLELQRELYGAVSSN
jgi:type I restriction enzyme R subunit